LPSNRSSTSGISSYFWEYTLNGAVIATINANSNDDLAEPSFTASFEYKQGISRMKEAHLRLENGVGEASVDGRRLVNFHAKSRHTSMNDFRFEDHKSPGHIYRSEDFIDSSKALQQKAKSLSCTTHRTALRDDAHADALQDETPSGKCDNCETYTTALVQMAVVGYSCPTCLRSVPLLCCPACWPDGKWCNGVCCDFADGKCMGSPLKCCPLEKVCGTKCCSAEVPVRVDNAVHPPQVV
jgi:hypothetical protein